MRGSAKHPGRAKWNKRSETVVRKCIGTQHIAKINNASSSTCHCLAVGYQVCRRPVLSQRTTKPERVPSSGQEKRWTEEAVNAWADAPSLVWRPKILEESRMSDGQIHSF